MIRLSELVVPVSNLLEEVQLGFDVLQMDETTIQVLKENGRAAQTDSHMWVSRGGPPGKPVILFLRSVAVGQGCLAPHRGLQGLSAVGWLQRLRRCRQT